MESDRVKSDDVFPMYPFSKRIDNIDLAWDMALAEKEYKELGHEILNLSNVYSVGGEELRQVSEYFEHQADIESADVLDLWLNDPSNPIVNQRRQEYFETYDDIDAKYPVSNQSPRDYLIWAQTFYPGAPFLSEWYRIRDIEQKSEQAQEDQNSSLQVANEALPKYRYLRRNSMSPDEVSARSIIFEEDSKHQNPPVLKIDLKFIINKIHRESLIQDLDILLLLDRLGVKIDPYEDYYSDSTNYIYFEVEGWEAIVVPPLTYDEISSRRQLPLSRTKHSVKNAMQILNRELIVYHLA